MTRNTSSALPQETTITSVNADGTVTRRQAWRIPLREVYKIEAAGSSR